jgi:hypothetical protein
MKPIAAIILVSCLSTTAQAVETGMLTLACKGTAVTGHEDAKPDPVSTGLRVNFTAGTVQGFTVTGSLDVPIKITGIDKATVAFAGSSGPDWSLLGSIDRLTGEVEALYMTKDGTGPLLSVNYALKCRPTQRKF